MKTVKGDLIKMALDGEFDVIVHGCNCFCTMGAGIAKTIKDTWSSVYAADRRTVYGDRMKLGRTTYADVEDGKLRVINAYTQYKFGTTNGVLPVDYDAIESVFTALGNAFRGASVRIGYPAIGCGLAGGDWVVVSRIIEKALDGCNHTYVEFNG